MGERVEWEEGPDGYLRSPEHDHGPRVVRCWKCGAERWCGYGSCIECYADGRCTAAPSPGGPSND
jgi:hypothetical protein